MTLAKRQLSTRYIFNMYNTPATKHTHHPRQASEHRRRLRRLVRSHHLPLRDRRSLSLLKRSSLALLHGIQGVVLVPEALVAQQTIVEVALGSEAEVVVAREGEGQGVVAVGGDGGADGVATRSQYASREGVC
jgi:hypothetical protein